MKALMKLEMQKYNIRKYIAAAIFMILFSILFISVSLLDSATDPTQTKDTFASIFQMIEVLLSFIYIIFYGVLISNMILKEYNTRTILIMFTYPVDRKKFIGAKLLCISFFITLSLLLSYVCCCGYVIIVDYAFDLLAGSFEVSYIMDWLIRMVMTILICNCIGLLTFSVGMKYTSVSFTMVNAIVFIFIRQIALSSSYGYSENLLQTLLVIAITSVSVYYTLHHYILHIENK